MNAPAQIDPVTDEAEAVMTVLGQVDADPKLILLGKVDKDAYLAELRAEVAVDADITTTKGRDAIKSAAQSIRTRKASIDRARTGLTEHWRAQTARVNAVGKVVIGELDGLIVEVRGPVTAWEEAEAKRVEEADRIIADLTAAAIVTHGMNSAMVQERLDRIRGINLNPDVLGVRMEMATDLQRDAVLILSGAVSDLKAQEAQTAELDRLRAEQERSRIAAEQAERDRIAKEAAEAAAKAEADRIERAKLEAAEQAKRDAEAQARREQEERARAAQAEIDAANARAAEAERAKQAELDRIAQAEADRKRGEEIAAAEQARREADIAHRQQVIDTAAETLTKLGLTKKLATAVVNEVAAGNVPAMQVLF